jgi:ABC-2 type transport system permease protein
VRALRVQTAAEIRMALRQGESLLVTLGIPLLLLVFFTLVPVVPTGSVGAVSFLTPGVAALAVMSTAMVSLGIATGFERSYGVLKRLGTTPLGRPRLLTAKVVSVLAVEVLQAVVLLAVAAGLGWRAAPDAGLAVGAVLLATAAFAGMGLLLAGTLRAELNLAVVNGLYLVLLLLGGMVFSLSKLPVGLHDVADALPSAALSQILYNALGPGTASTLESWVVLAAWAVAAPLAAAATFRWE